MSCNLFLSGASFRRPCQAKRLLIAATSPRAGAGFTNPDSGKLDRACLKRQVTAVLRSACWSMLLAGAVWAQGTPDPQRALEGAALVQALRQGGYVIYFRHADTGPAYMEQGIDLARCETQRNLNDNGREEAALIGAALRRLAIPIGEVRSSEFCRCKETAQLAFGRFETDRMLTGVSRSAEAAPRREQAAQALRKMLATPPPAGRNNVLVSHGFNLWDAQGFHLGTQGEAAIFKADGSGGYALVARLMPRAWAQLPSD